MRCILFIVCLVLSVGAYAQPEASQTCVDAQNCQSPDSTKIVNENQCYISAAACNEFRKNSNHLKFLDDIPSATVRSSFKPKLQGYQPTPMPATSRPSLPSLPQPLTPKPVSPPTVQPKPTAPVLYP